MTLGVGAALASGSGIAHAQGPASSDDSSPSATAGPAAKQTSSTHRLSTLKAASTSHGATQASVTSASSAPDRQRSSPGELPAAAGVTRTAIHVDEDLSLSHSLCGRPCRKGARIDGAVPTTAESAGSQLFGSETRASADTTGSPGNTIAGTKSDLVDHFIQDASGAASLASASPATNSYCDALTIAVASANLADTSTVGHFLAAALKRLRTTTLPGGAAAIGAVPAGIPQTDVNGALEAALPTIDYQALYGGYGLSPDGTRLFVTNKHSVEVFDTRTRTKLYDIAFDDGTNGFVGSAMSSGGNVLYIGVQHANGAGYDGEVAVIDVTNRSVVKSIALGPNAMVNDIVFAGGTNMYVYSSRGSGADDNSISVVDTASNEIIRTLNLGAGFSRSNALAVSPDGSRVYVRWDSGTHLGVEVFDGTTGTSMAFIPAESDDRSNLVASPDGRRLYVVTAGVGGDEKVQVIDTISNSVIQSITVPSDNWHSDYGLGISSDGRFIYVSQTVADDNTDPTAGGKVMVSIIDTYTYAFTGTTSVGLNKQTVTGGGIEGSPDGRLVYLPAYSYSTPSSNDGQPVVLVLNTAKITVGSNPSGDGDGGSSPDVKKLLEIIMGVGSITNEVTHWIDNLSKTYNLSEVLRGIGLIKGVEEVLDGISKGDPRQALTGVTDILSTPLMGGLGLLVESLKLIVSVFWPMSDAEEAAFWDFRIRCMFHKSEADLTFTEAQTLVKRYSMPAILLNLPMDYGRYNVGNWFGHPTC